MGFGIDIPPAVVKFENQSASYRFTDFLIENGFCWNGGSSYEDTKIQPDYCLRLDPVERVTLRGTLYGYRDNEDRYINEVGIDEDNFLIDSDEFIAKITKNYNSFSSNHLSDLL